MADPRQRRFRAELIKTLGSRRIRPFGHSRPKADLDLRQTGWPVVTMVVEEHHSPDGVLTFVVEAIGDDVALGFAQTPWHTHADFLVPAWGSTKTEAVQAYTDALLSGEAVIAVRRRDGTIVEAWIIEDLDFEADAACESETLELRHWDGRLWAEASREP